jgi:hypothetical protein
MLGGASGGVTGPRAVRCGGLGRAPGVKVVDADDAAKCAGGCIGRSGRGSLRPLIPAPPPHGASTFIMDVGPAPKCRVSVSMPNECHAVGVDGFVECGHRLGARALWVWLVAAAGDVGTVFTGDPQRCLAKPPVPRRNLFGTIYSMPETAHARHSVVCKTR